MQEAFTSWSFEKGVRDSRSAKRTVQALMWVHSSHGLDLPAKPNATMVTSSWRRPLTYATIHRMIAKPRSHGGAYAIW